MYIVKPENPNDAFFRASKKVKHSGACGSECNHFNKRDFDESRFCFPDVLRNLEFNTPSASGAYINHSAVYYLNTKKH